MSAPIVSPRAIAALRRLTRKDAHLRQDSRGGFAVAASLDARRRPSARLSAQDGKMLLAEGLLEPAPARGGAQIWRIARAGRAYLARLDNAALIGAPCADTESEAAGEPLAPQSAALRRLRLMQNVDGAPWFSAAELRAAESLQRDHRLGRLGQRVTADWSAPPMDRARRAAPNSSGGLECAIDARARLAQARRRLGAQLDAVLADLLADDLGLEELERKRGWPARSAKVALKLGLSVLAESAS